MEKWAHPQIKYYALEEAMSLMGVMLFQEQNSELMMTIDFG